jgi:hypothetical protein
MNGPKYKAAEEKRNDEAGFGDASPGTQSGAPA